MRSIVYHQFRRNCISSKRNALYIIIAKAKYSLRLMICTFGDEIHAKAWWYTIAFAMDKKIRQVSTCRIFWLRNRDSPRALQLHSSLRDSYAVRPLPCGTANVSPTRLLGFAAVPFESLHNKTKKPPCGGFLFWLRNRDSNPNKQSQSLPCCRYTIPQYFLAQPLVRRLFYHRFRQKSRL